MNKVSQTECNYPNESEHIRDYVLSHGCKFNVWSFTSRVDGIDSPELPDTLFDIKEMENYMVCIYSPHKGCIGTFTSLDVNNPKYYNPNKKVKVDILNKYLLGALTE